MNEEKSPSSASSWRLRSLARPVAGLKRFFTRSSQEDDRVMHEALEPRMLYSASPLADPEWTEHVPAPSAEQASPDGGARDGGAPAPVMQPIEANALEVDLHIEGAANLSDLDIDRLANDGDLIFLRGKDGVDDDQAPSEAAARLHWERLTARLAVADMPAWRRLFLKVIRDDQRKYGE